MDVLTRKQRSYCMSRIKSKDTSIEICLRSAIHKLGYRFKKHVSALPGKPDIVFPKQKVVIFIDGDFWHGRRFSSWSHKLSPKWKRKISENIKRDRRNRRKLQQQGWIVKRFWGTAIKHEFEEVLARVISVIENAK